MKKLLSFLAVAAIVTSAFAFTNKSMALSYCVFDGNNACFVIQNRVEDAGGANFLHFPFGPGANDWDGTHADCNAAVKADCDVPIKLKID